MKLFALILLVGSLLVSACSSKSEIQAAATSNTTAGNTAPVSPASDFDEKKAEETVKRYLNNRAKNGNWYEFLSIGPFFKNPAGDMVEASYSYILHYPSLQRGVDGKSNETRRATFKRASNGKWYLTTIRDGDLEVK
jgi:hypothetical protein